MTSRTPTPPAWMCSQIGAREHFAIPRALHQSGRLAALFTDFWAAQTVRSMQSRIPVSALRALAARYHPKLANAPVKSWNLRSLGWEAGRRYRWAREPVFGGYPGFIEVGRRFSMRVREALRRYPGLGPDSIFFAYDTGALEAFEWCRERGIKCALGQVDPSRVEVDLVQEEERRWPGWRTQSAQVPEEYFQRREQEWALADRIIVNSEFCRKALIQQGVPLEKLVIIPLCYEPEVQSGQLSNLDPEPSSAHSQRASAGASNLRARSASAPLRVLFLGQVILRKGIQYLIEAAKLLEGEHIAFDVVGPVGISKTAMASAPKSVLFHGRVTRDQAAAWYRAADVFALPTLSDGFALTQLEAMSYGVPVATTKCCGAVVADGLDGFIVPPRDARALANSLQRYLREPGLLQSQREAALVKSRQFGINYLANNLIQLERLLLGRSEMEPEQPRPHNPSGLPLIPVH